MSGHPPTSKHDPIEPPENTRRHRRHKEHNSGFVQDEVIGKGSFATVYHGMWGGNLYPGDNPPPQQEVAIKVVDRSRIRRDPRLLSIFEGEMAILKKMQHPHVVHLIDVIETKHDYNLVMEYCSMGDLSRFIRGRRRLIKHNPDAARLFERFPSPNAGLHTDLVRHILSQLASALLFLNERHLVHRDLKPQNLLLCPAPSSPEEAAKLNYVGNWDMPVVKVADFGFARFLPAASMAETMCGSPLYMAPEILNREKYNAGADLWSVGAVTYEMAVGKPPFPASNPLELMKMIDERTTIDLPDTVSDDVALIIRGLLRRAPQERMSLAEFYKAANPTLDQADTYLPTKPLVHSEPVSPTTSSSSSPNSHQDSHQSSISPQGSTRSQAVSDSEMYVLIEKRTVEVNSLADHMQAPRIPENPRRRRLSSIAYGASPTGALAQALLRSSVRLFGSKPTDSSVRSHESSLSPCIHTSPSMLLAAPKDGERQITDELEQHAAIAKVVALYAEVKYSQLDLESDSVSLSDPYLQLRVVNEALALHLKTLTILSKAMDLAGEWWEHELKMSKGSSQPAPGINALVQWVRDKFNECMDRAETEKALRTKLIEDTGLQPPDINAERLLFDRALETAKSAAVQEVTSTQPDSHRRESTSASEMSYGTAIWMLKALLIADPPDELSESDREMVETLMAKMVDRLAAVRLRYVKYPSPSS